jgi:hypothetical protein
MHVVGRTVLDGSEAQAAVPAAAQESGPPVPSAGPGEECDLENDMGR